MSSKISYITIDTSKALSDLCILGAHYVTDKSPYNSVMHRHPYTAVYDMLFAPRRYQPIVFGEIGVMNNASMCMWRSYFPTASLYGFEINTETLAAVKAHNLPNTHYSFMDSGSPQSIFDALNDTKQLFDVIIDDSNHHFENQMAIASVAYEFLKPGGVLIIEDIFRPWGEARYEEALAPYMKYFSSAAFFETNHENLWSPGTQEPWFNNDKLLVMYRNQEPAQLRTMGIDLNSPYLAEALKRKG
jgi:SAM-dependent methyltransferase